MSPHDDGFFREPTPGCASAEQRAASREGDPVAVTLDKLPHVAVQWFDSAGRVLFWNQASEQLYGYSRSEALGRTLGELIYTPEQQAFFHDLMHRALAGDEVLGPELQTVRHRDGSRRSILASLFVLRAGQGESVFVCVDVDVTREQDAHESLSLERQLLRTVMDENPNIIILKDWDGHFLMANRGLAELYNTTIENLIGKTDGDFNANAEQVRFFLENARSIMRDGKTRVVMEESTHAETGETRYYRSIKKPLRGADGEPCVLITASDVTDLHLARQQIRQLTYHDALTQLPNRVLLADRMQQAIALARRDGSMLAVAYIDLDGFKPINDVYGHAVGDALLVQMAERLRNTAREGDTVARIGGDEFVLLLSHLSDKPSCERILLRVLAALAEPVVRNGAELQVSASIGVTLYPDDESDADALIRHADQAMYQAKLQGRNRYHFFDPAHDRKMQAARELCERVVTGLQLGEFELFYQPRIDLIQRRVQGAEALIRWRHPGKGLLLPGAFLPQIEGSACMIAMGRWVLEQAVQQLAQWRRAGLDIAVSINIAAPHLLASDFVTHLAQVLAAFPDVPPAMLELEILESTALEDMEAVRAILAECRALGVRFALDDFGTGYSSLIYLRRLPVDTLKIDRSFVRDMLDDAEDHTIVQAVIGLGNAFGRHVVAEGVETERHGQALMGLGCHQLQGFGIARPMPAPELHGWIESYVPSFRPVDA
ncbi:MAG: putative bifunctional diguanylate cyclase/phosphodiesterase [Pseudomonadota bacterium]